VLQWTGFSPCRAGQNTGEASDILLRAAPLLPVTPTDSPRGIRHSVEVTAESLFKSGVLSVSAFRRAGCVEEAPGVGSHLEIEVVSLP